MALYMTHLHPGLDQLVPSPLATAMYASSEVADTIMLVWKTILVSVPDASVASPDATRDGLMYACMSNTYLLVQHSPQSYDRIQDILRKNILSVLAKAFQFKFAFDSSSSHEIFVYGANTLLQNLLAPSTVHRKILPLMNRSIATIPSGLGKSLPLRHPQIAEGAEA